MNLVGQCPSSIHEDENDFRISRKVGWSCHHQLSRLRRLKLLFIAELQPLHLARSVVLIVRMQFKVEIEARLTNFELWIPIARFLSRHAFASLISFQFSKNFGGHVDHRPDFARFGDVTTVFDPGNILSLAVERKGFEPLTPGLQSRCSPN